MKAFIKSTSESTVRSSIVHISAVVMASGLSRRMGGDKLHLQLGNKYIYEYILDTALLYPFHEVLVAAKDDEILAKAREHGFKGIRNTRHYMGQSASIKAALNASHSTDGYMFFVADQPFLHPDTIKLLCSTFERNPNRIVVPDYNGKRGNPVIFPCSLKEQLLKIEGDQGGRAILQVNKEMILHVPVASEWEHFDIDTREDYELAEKIRIDCLPAK